MQHLDEGTIHAWLDGALAPEEAARADAHVKDCPQCQAAVAEARGFIAASSRILTALDDAPRGVIPVAAPKQRVQPWMWRVAATMLVVATGTVLLVTQRGSQRTSASKVAVDSALSAAVPTAAMPSADSPAVGPGTVSGVETAPPSAFRAMTPHATELKVKPTPNRATARQAPALDKAESPARVGERRADGDLRSNMAAPTVTPAPTFGRAGAVAGTPIGTETLPREVATKRMIGRTQTFYEIAPGDTVVLEEQSSPQLEAVVVTGAAVGRAQLQARTSKAAAATESQQKAEAAAAPSPAQPAAAPPPPSVAALQDAPAGDRHAISWLDPSTRRVVILSGRHSQEELQKIREQIQRLRDAAQPKRNPD